MDKIEEVSPTDPALIYVRGVEKQRDDAYEEITRLRAELSEAQQKAPPVGGAGEG
jgi:hypothetical protein